MKDLNLSENIVIQKIDYEALTVEVSLFPDEGPFSGGQLDFLITIPELYPHRPPKAKIIQTVKKKKFDCYIIHLCRSSIPISITKDTCV